MTGISSNEAKLLLLKVSSVLNERSLALLNEAMALDPKPMTDQDMIGRMGILLQMIAHDLSAEVMREFGR